MPLPRIQPITPTWRKAPFDDAGWLSDVKYVRFRGLAYIEPGPNRLVSRNNNLMRRFEALAEQIASLLDVHDAIIDGELITTDQTGRPQFYHLLRRARPPTSRLICCGSMAPICLPFHSASAGRV
jgi:ATP-dependent DNA ligase